MSREGRFFLYPRIALVSNHTDNKMPPPYAFTGAAYRSPESCKGVLARRWETCETRILGSRHVLPPDDVAYGDTNRLAEQNNPRHGLRRASL